jgi:hypothetical protein
MVVMVIMVVVVVVIVVGASVIFTITVVVRISIAEIRVIGPKRTIIAPIVGLRFKKWIGWAYVKRSCEIIFLIMIVMMVGRIVVNIGSKEVRSYKAAKYDYIVFHV